VYVSQNIAETKKMLKAFEHLG